MQPGDTLHPGSSSGGDPSNKNEGVVETPQNQSDTPQNQGWYHAETPAQEQAPASPMPSLDQSEASQYEHTDDAEVAWTGSEFIAHEKPAVWYVSFVFIALLIAVVTYIVTREIITVVAVVGALGAFGAMATRRPRVLDYALDDHGVHIGPKFYPYSFFRSFSLFDDGAMHAIDLMPMERFKSPVTVYFPPEQETSILQKMGDNLAYEERTPDLVDRLMHRLRF